MSTPTPETPTLTLSQIASIAGKPGLYVILKPTHGGVIIESLDGARKRTVVSGQARVSLLSEISIYTDTREGAAPLPEVLTALHSLYGEGELPVSGRSTGPELSAFLASVLPDYDRERVYSSDIKKLLSWYGVLRQHAPETLSAPADEAPAAEGHPEAAAGGQADA